MVVESCPPNFRGAMGNGSSCAGLDPSARVRLSVPISNSRPRRTPAASLRQRTRDCREPALSGFTPKRRPEEVKAPGDVKQPITSGRVRQHHVEERGLLVTSLLGDSRPVPSGKHAEVRRETSHSGRRVRLDVAACYSVAFVVTRCETRWWRCGRKLGGAAWAHE